jgi:exonuclease SbcC
MQEKAKLEEQERLAQTRQEMLNRYTDDLKRIEQEYDDYQQIAIALGKDGIQALLIEEILPEIEHEANELLGQLTNNQAHIIIEPLKDLKKGGTKETLDIKISDPMGIRPYELFSGGEAFRIDFALRIAISKLLARRAGTSLQTLIIDEGFGSQDEEGIMHIMEALYAIQDHFAKIIIVSHLPVMKEQFPVHFFVDKGPQGSSITVVQH